MMTQRIRAAVLALAATSFVMPTLAEAQCSTATAGARCIRVMAEPPVRPGAEVMSNASAATPLFTTGDMLPRGEYSMILNADYYGLPPAGDGWVYMRVGTDAYRVDWRTHQVLERVMDKAAANF